jgi:hypothetical protein
MMPKLRETFTKHNQLVQPLFSLAGIPLKAVFSGALKNYDAHCNEIWSQNSAASRRESSDEEDEPMEVVSDDETVGNLNVSTDEEPHASFRSRSTIL